MGTIYKKEFAEELASRGNAHFPEYEHLSIEEAEKFLDECETRIIQRECKSCKSGYEGEMQVLYKSDWLPLARVSLFDNVATGHCGPENFGWYMKACRENVNFGARIRKEAGGGYVRVFGVLTHTTDG